MPGPRTADVIIIGGGVTGASTAFHLTRCGITDVVVVDKGTLASGGTGKSSACVRQHYTTAETCRMIRYALDCFERLLADHQSTIHRLNVPCDAHRVAPCIRER